MSAWPSIGPRALQRRPSSPRSATGTASSTARHIRNLAPVVARPSVRYRRRSGSVRRGIGRGDADCSELCLSAPAGSRGAHAPCRRSVRPRQSSPVRARLPTLPSSLGCQRAAAARDRSVRPASDLPRRRPQAGSPAEREDRGRSSASCPPRNFAPASKLGQEVPLLSRHRRGILHRRGLPGMDRRLAGTGVR